MARPFATKEQYIERFLSKIRFTEDCWIWTGNPTQKYGRFKVRDKELYVHVIAYRFWNGCIPKGYQVDHTCTVCKCVNPNHLEAVPQAVNLLRSRGWEQDWDGTWVCKRGHRVEGYNAIKQPNHDLPRCRECQRIAGRKHDRLRKR